MRDEMSKLAFCPGSRRALALDRRTSLAKGEKVLCPECGLTMEPRGGKLPDHRFRKCIIPGCTRPRGLSGFCEACRREIAA